MNGLAVLIGISSLLASLSRAFGPRLVAAHATPGGIDGPSVVGELLRTDEPIYAEIVARELLSEAETRHGPRSLEAAIASELIVDTMLAGWDARAPRLAPARLAQAQRFAERAVKLREAHVGPLHASLAQALRKLARIKAARWGPAAAVPHLARALRIVEGHRRLAAMAPRLASELGQAQLLAGRRAEARRMLDYALHLLDERPARGTEFITLSNHVARLHLDDGDAGGARPVLERAFLYAESSAADPLLIAGTAYNLGLVLLAQAEPEEARVMFERALELEREALGPDHPDLAATLIELAQCSEKDGAFAEARRELLEAQRILETAHGPEAPEMAPVLAPLARLHAACGEPQQGRPLLARLLVLRRNALGPDHPDLVVTMNNLAWLAEAGGNYIDARSWREQALGVAERAWGADHPNLAPTLEALGALLWASDDWVGCRRVNESLLRIRRLEMGPDHPAVAQKLQDLAVLATRDGDDAAASRRFDEALDVLERTPILDRTVLRNVLQNLELLAEQETGGAFVEQLVRARGLDRRFRAARPLAEA